MKSQPPRKRSASPLPFAIGDARMAPSADPLLGKWFRIPAPMQLHVRGRDTIGRVLHRFDQLLYVCEVYDGEHAETRLVPVEAFAGAEIFETEDELDGGPEGEGNGAAAE